MADDQERSARARTTVAASLLILSLCAVWTVGRAPASAAASSPPTAHGVGPHVTADQKWTATVAAPAGGITVSSPNEADLPGGPAVVVGDLNGYVDAYNLATGGQVPGWPFNAGSPVNSTPSVAATQSGGLDSVFVGVGNAQNPYEGGYQAISPQGTNQWFDPESNPGTDPYPHNGVMASMAVGDLQGGTDVVAGSLGENMYAMNAGTAPS